MPSLPELEVYKHHLATEIVGHTIIQVEPLDFRVVHAPGDALEQFLVGHAVTEVGRYGKWLILSTGATEQLIIHLGLTGKLHLLAPSDELPRFSCFTIQFDDNRRLVLSDQRHLGKVYLRPFDELKAEKNLGPDLLDIAQPYFVTVLRAKHRAVRDVLMDQKLIAGIGGKYADEILWQAKTHPHVKSSTLAEPELVQLYQLTRHITDSAIALDAEVERFPQTWLIPHRHTDKVCPRCSGPLADYSGAFFCPYCQAPPTPTA